ncbi:hypothetical protein HYE67_008335 [Fusarium culmorum]|uniref:Uncharacterized protein n=1 Tax=Fusarium culmorum TaxID=5516 RepID=A0A2T4H5X4_FUSCU|nr:hypothetical protein FCULG_00003026 [Fusarium culmorum]QPC66104.1 hypothetical protein HYE67_008335 [Fusarium culmorum]
MVCDRPPRFPHGLAYQMVGKQPYPYLWLTLIMMLGYRVYHHGVILCRVEPMNAYLINFPLPMGSLRLRSHTKHPRAAGDSCDEWRCEHHYPPLDGRTFMRICDTVARCRYHRPLG